MIPHGEDRFILPPPQAFSVKQAKMSAEYDYWELVVQGVMAYPCLLIIPCASLSLSCVGDCERGRGLLVIFFGGAFLQYPCYLFFKHLDPCSKKATECVSTIIKYKLFLHLFSVVFVFEQGIFSPVLNPLSWHIMPALGDGREGSELDQGPVVQSMIKQIQD